MRSVRELEQEAARDVADFVDAAATPLEAYRRALARLTPVLDASFASVFVPARKPGLYRLACAQNWPQSSAWFLGEVRIRKGRGPTGRAISRNEPVQVDDVFEDAELEEWWEPARELGFVSILSLPLSHSGRRLGALSFYFDERREIDRGTRQLLLEVADRLAGRITDLEGAGRRIS